MQREIRARTQRDGPKPKKGVVLVSDRGGQSVNFNFTPPQNVKTTKENFVKRNWAVLFAQALQAQF